MKQLSYCDLVIEHFDRPRNHGQWPQAPDIIIGTAGSVSRGAQFTFSARVATGVIQAARFLAYGCPHLIASGSWLSERLRGCTLQDLERWNWRQVADVLRVPTEKHGRLLVLEDAVRALASDWARKSGK
jgi:NifU-like protein involved in Fe-S cluster formation